MKIEIEVDSINYAELVSVFLPKIKELRDNSIVGTISNIPPSLAGKVIEHIPQSTLDSVVEIIINNKQDSIRKSLEDLAKKNGVSIKLNTISIKK